MIYFSDKELDDFFIGGYFIVGDLTTRALGLDTYRREFYLNVKMPVLWRESVWQKNC